MIDRRNISYTEGNPLTPISAGKLVVTPIDSTPNIKAGEHISKAKSTTPKKVVTVIDTIAALGPVGLAKVYTTGGAYGSKEAVKTTITEVAKSQGLPTQPIEELWKTKEVTEWQPKAELPVIGEIPSIQINPADPFGLPSFEDLKGPLLIAAGLIGAALFLPSIIGAFKK